MKVKKSILILTILSLIFAPLVVNGEGAENDHFLIHRSYIKGFQDGTFRPNDPITREQVLSVIDLHTYIAPPFAESIGPIVPDVSLDRWSYGAIESCIRNGMAQPLFEAPIYNEDGSMSVPLDQNIYPTKPITRGELVAILYAGKDKFFVESPEHIRNMKFNDISGHRFEKEIIDMANRGVINGYPDNTFRPDKEITRAEFVVIMNAFLGRCDAKKINEKINVFKDVYEKDWYYYDIIEAAVNHSYREIDATNVWIKPLTEEEVRQYIWW